MISSQELILQVHDELLVETAEDEVETVKQIMLDGMKNAVSLKVPLEVDLKGRKRLAGGSTNESYLEFTGGVERQDRNPVCSVQLT